ncbi:MAG: hypothetical protein OEX04_01545 [Acidimicrobiia bacterium]|nr:hypothetical protein [Acidimicrobiia bacterium]MDH4306138.1 hypothetical protein [Acidimicrobiia bacterium]MDH5292121.1 hypothetical protein [Acidimicrobiia bacterium]
MRRFALLLAMVVAAVACGGGNEDAATGVDFREALTVVASSPGSLGVGSQRVLMVVASPDGNLLGSPDEETTVRFEIEGEVWDGVATDWVWGIEGVRGFYVATFDFPRAGVWSATISNSGSSAQTSTFQVQEDPVVPEVGESAPPSQTLTAADAPLSEISTDPEPDPRLYEISIADAVESGQPSVIVFATPAFCTTAICGPTLEVVKAVAQDHEKVHFIHVEVYENVDDPGGELVEVDAIGEWGLLTEPWVFVIDANGVVSARYEGTVGAAELEDALDALDA